MRERLDETTTEQIESRLPDLAKLGNRLLVLTPDFVSMAFEPDSTVPVAVPCLTDALHVSYEARYALFEAYAHLAWHRDKSPTPNAKAAVFFARFYTNAAASCLYAAAEDVAEALIQMFELDRASIDTKAQKQSSLNSKVGKYFLEKMPTEDLTQFIRELAESDSWRKTVDWRNNWVHEQSLVHGLGIVYDRTKRWRGFAEAGGEQGFLLSSGKGGDTPEYSIDDVLAFVNAAFCGFVRTFEEAVNSYRGILLTAGISEGPEVAE